MLELLWSAPDRVEHFNIIRYSLSIKWDSNLTCRPVAFPALKSLEIGSACYIGFKFGELLKKIITTAPKLTAILYGISSSRELMALLLPTEKFYLLTQLILSIETDKAEKMYRRLCYSPPALQRLRIENPIVDEDVPFGASFQHVLRRLLLASQSSLKFLEVQGKSFEISRMFQILRSHLAAPRLVSLSELFLWSDRSETDFSSCVGGIDFDEIFPTLKKIALHHQTLSDDEDDSSDEDGEMRNLADLQSGPSSTVTYLELKLESYRNTSFNQLKQTFPAVTSLRISFSGVDNVPSLWQVIRLWPELEVLRLKGEATTGLWRNYDAHFCGTSREEMRELWGKSSEFLSKVRIVPVRPCLSTLRSESSQMLLQK